MPLQKQLIQLPFGGLQTKADPKVAPLGTYQVIDNFIMKQYHELVKRDGLSTIGLSTSPSNITTSYNYINEVGVITTKGLYSYSPSLDQFQSKGNTASPVVTADPIIANTYYQLNCDIGVTDNNIIGSIWEDSRGGVRASVKDSISDTYLQADYSLSSSVTALHPKVIAVGNELIFLWVETSTSTLMAQQYNTISATLFSAVPISTVMANGWVYDVIPSMDNLLIAAVETNASPNAITAYYYNTKTANLAAYPDGLPAPTSMQFTHTGTNPPAISLAVDPTNTYLTLSVYNDSNEVWTKTYFIEIGTNLPEVKVSSATTDPGWIISSCISPANDLYIFYSSLATKHNSFQARLSNVNVTPTLTYNQDFILQMGVTSKSFFFNDNAYVIVGYNHPLQATYFGVRDDGACFGRFFTQVGGSPPTRNNCPSAFVPIPGDVNTYIVSLLKTTEISSGLNNSYFTTTSVFTEKIYFTPSDIDNQVLGNLLNISGGYLKQYDGSPTVFEQGFHTYPEAPTLVQSNTMSGQLTTSGSYSYIVCWEWRDNYGQLHRSEPSVPTTITMTGSNNTVTVSVPPLAITDKQTRFSDVRSPVIMAVYRTQTLGTIYYRVNQLATDFVFNNSLATSLSYIDIVSDVNLGFNSLLYTTGGVFQNVPTPSANLMAVCKNRVILAGIDTEPNQVFFSKEKEEGIGIEFSNELSFIVDSLGGAITALAAMDDKIIIFKKSLVFYVGGVLPDKLGNGAAPYPLLIASDCGCTNPQSIVLTGLGIMFQSPKGIYLIDRQLNVSYIGQQVDRITNPSTGPISITSAVNLPDKNLVYFTDSNNNQVLVYDTYFQQWYTQSLGFSPLSSTLLNASVYFSSNSNMFQSIPNQSNDDGNSITSRVKTNWISLANMEGFQRIYAIMILGDNAQLQHTLNVNLYYDFEEFPRESLTITPTALLSNPWGSDADWGTSTPWGDTSVGGLTSPPGAIYDGTYQFIVRPREQKCSSIQIEIFDSFPDGSRTQSLKFSGISLVAGIKSGWNRGIPYTQRLT